MLIEEDAFLEHFGKKGMRWGQRKSPEEKASVPSNNHKKLKIAGAVILAGSAAAGAAYAHHVLGKNGTNRLMSGKDRAKAAKKIVEAKKLVEKMTKEEPTSIIHASKGKNTGFTFLKHGGLTDPLHEFEKGFGTSEPAVGTFKRYGDNLEKVAVSFHDPEGRVDRAGRKIMHDVILPEQHARGIGTHAAAARKAWVMVKNGYDQHYQNSLK